MRIILVIDRPGSSYYNIASTIKQYFDQVYPGEFQFCISYGSLRNESADLAVVFKWTQMLSVMSNNRIKRSILCLYDHVTWNRTHEDEHAFMHAIRKSDFLAVGNQQIADNIRLRELDSIPVFLVEDGVNCKQFTQRPLPAQFTVGWCGNSQHGMGAIKGLDLIKEACNMTKTELVVSDLAENKKLPLHKMPAWYDRVCVYVCASVSEGTPNPVLEAMACGRPVITTRVGITERLIVDGVNGYFVERYAEDIAEKIQEIKTSGRLAEMGALARFAAESYDWNLKMNNWRLLLSAAAVTI